MMVPRDVHPEIIDVLDALEQPGTERTAIASGASDADPMLANLHNDNEC
jgi:hypothetical protein